MKKVVEMIIGNTVFLIEEDAFDILAQYLGDIRKYFADKQEDQDEIVKDIEASIAEKFRALTKGARMPITLTGVQNVIKELGTPLEMDDSFASDTENTGMGAQPEIKKLYRDVDNAVVAGVARGIAVYLGIDPTIVRLLFLVTTLFSGLGLVVYILAWILIPPARTTAQKLEMKGKPVNLEEISTYIKKKLKTATIKPKNRVLEASFAFLGQVYEVSKTVLFYVVGLSLIIVAVVGIIVLITGFLLMPEILYFVFQLFDSTGVWGPMILFSAFLALFSIMWLLFIVGVNLAEKKMLFSRHSLILWLVIFFANISVLSALTAFHTIEISNNPNMVYLHQAVDNIHTQYHTHNPWWHTHGMHDRIYHPLYWYK